MDRTIYGPYTLINIHVLVRELNGSFEASYGAFSLPAILYKNKKFTPQSLAVKSLRMSEDVLKQNFLFSGSSAWPPREKDLFTSFSPLEPNFDMPRWIDET